MFYGLVAEFDTVFLSVGLLVSLSVRAISITTKTTTTAAISPSVAFLLEALPAIGVIPTTTADTATTTKTTKTTKKS